MAILNDAARRLIEAGALAHLVTLNPDGSPQVTVIWVGIDGDELVAGHWSDRQRKLANIRRDPRVVLSFESDYLNSVGTRDHMVVHGTAEVVDGGAAEVLGRLVKTYVGPEAEYPPPPGSTGGCVTRITVTKVGGIGEWAA